MSDFKCECRICGKRETFENLRQAYMNGWNFGKTQMCYECEQKEKTKVQSSAFVKPVSIEG